MARKPAEKVTDYHVIPHWVPNMRDELIRQDPTKHITDAGTDCPCEPYCAIQTNLFRLIVHQSHAVDIIRRAPEPPRGPIGPERQLPSGE